MPLNQELLASIRENNYKSYELNLSGQNLNDADIEALVSALDRNSNITSLDVSNNHLTHKSAFLLAKNMRLKKLVLKKGNSDITTDCLSYFLENTTLTEFPIVGGSGEKLKKIREHIKENANRISSSKITPHSMSPILKPVETSSEKSLKVHAASVEEKLALYSKKPVSQKKKTGEGNFLQLTAYLLFDLNRFNSTSDYIVWYTAIALNLFMHNSSHRPLSGYGKAQNAEAKYPLYYYRSQTDHPHRRFIDQVTKIATVDGKSLLLRNSVAEEQIVQHLESKELSNGLSSLDTRGFVIEKDKMPNYFALFLAYSGLRATNLFVYLDALKNASIQKIISVLPSSNLVEFDKISSSECVKKIKTLKEKVASLVIPTDIIEISNDLYSKLLNFRYKQANNIFHNGVNVEFKHIALEAVGTCLFIKIYPDFDKEISKTANYKEGITNTIMGFWGGLINHLCHIKGLHLHVDRRQSFGFLRASLTDIGSLRFRLSLGFEPEVFHEVIAESLWILDRVLYYYDFRDRENYFVSKYFIPVEKSRKKDGSATQKTGTALLKAMRSEEKQWLSFNEAKEFLDECYDSSDLNYIWIAIENYFNAVVALSGESISSRTDRYLKNKLEKYTKAMSENVCQANYNYKNSVLLELLMSIVSYSVNSLKNLPSINESTLFIYSLQHSIEKLLNNCQKGIYIILHAKELEMSHLSSKATLLIENMLEYLISIDTIVQIFQNQDPVSRLYITEKNHVMQALDVRTEVDIYFTDSGQQAITMSLLIMDDYLAGESKNKHRSDRAIFVFNESYYELELFFNKIKQYQTKTNKFAKILFIDVVQLPNLKLTEFENLESVVIDITYQPNMSNQHLQDRIRQFHKNNIFVTLVSSALKHDQLGLDKYQSGKIVMLPPEDKGLSKDLKEVLQKVSNQAMHPLIASYLQMVNEICREKVNLQMHYAEQPSKRKGKQKKSSFQ